VGDFPVEFSELLDRPESEALEFKSDLREPRAAAQLVSSLANSGGGHIVLGAREQRGPVVGLDNPEQTRAILEGAAQAILPSVPLAIDEGTVGGKPVLIATVHPEKSAGPYMPPSGAIFKRDQDGRNVPLTGHELIQAFASSAPDGSPEPAWEAALAEMNTRLAALEQTANNGFDEAAAARRWQAQIWGWVISGVIGALIGAAISLGVTTLLG
jgi:predicted HTH transcriptional regulator